MKKVLTISPVALLLFFSISASALAQTHADFVYDTYVSRHLDQTLALTLEANTNLDTSVSSDSDGNVIDVNSGTGADVDVSAPNSGGGSAGVSGSAAGDAGAQNAFGETLLIHRGAIDVSATGRVGLGEQGAITSSEVTTRADLEAYASSRVAANERVEQVEFSGERMRISFKEEGRLFGFIPVAMTSHAEVRADGSVEISRPWYRFLVATSGGAQADVDLETRIQAALSASPSMLADASAEASQNASLSASAQARILDEVLVSTAVDTAAAASGDISY